MKGSKQLSEADRALFREAVAGTSRLSQDRVDLRTTPPKPIPAKTLEDEQRALQELLTGEFDDIDLETGDELRFLRPGVQKTLLRRLRSGGLSIQAELDLHGLIVAEARQALAAFLYDCRQQGLRCVRIIHGKGYNSPGKNPVLKGKVNAWLQQRDEVLGFVSARPVDGGTGAVLVLLSRH